MEWGFCKYLYIPKAASHFPINYVPYSALHFVLHNKFTVQCLMGPPVNQI